MVTENVNFYSLVLGQQSFKALYLNKCFSEVFQYILKSLKTFSLIISKNTKIQIRQKRTWTNFDLTTETLIEKYLNNFNKV